jgi:hypothetical protein
MNKISQKLLALFLASSSVSAFAVAPATLADLTTSISFVDVSLAILAITAALIGIAVTWKGAKLVLKALGFSM